MRRLHKGGGGWCMVEGWGQQDPVTRLDSTHTLSTCARGIWWWLDIDMGKSCSWYCIARGSAQPLRFCKWTIRYKLMNTMTYVKYLSMCNGPDDGFQITLFNRLLRMCLLTIIRGKIWILDAWFLGVVFWPDQYLYTEYSFSLDLRIIILRTFFAVPFMERG